eukprot:CAMPEP_0196205800 /NCGR_PEP_ID=MMETSP0912-20130531/7424_1 /TAXON_ID=49265 /ORGANISM="Thalassiosira rotula, Strain GSO102" /LENGTH=62 /DNA_ID=CAMNT_0041480245 /DNA_START=248 /DNA_END=436 /DNA_ORIENTATION=-
MPQPPNRVPQTYDEGGGAGEIAESRCDNSRSEGGEYAQNSNMEGNGEGGDNIATTDRIDEGY